MSAHTGVHAQSTAGANGEGDSTALVIDRELRVRVIRLLDITSQEILAQDERGQRLDLPIDSVLAIVRTGPLAQARLGVGAPMMPLGEALPTAVILQRTQAMSAGVLETIDGGRYPGTLALFDDRLRRADAGLIDDASAEVLELMGSDQVPDERAAAEPVVDAVVWRDGLSDRVYPLERVARIVLPDAPVSARVTLPDAGDEDLLLLANGDTLRGFLAELGDGALLELEDGSMLDLPADRVSAAVLANDPEAHEGSTVWFSSGLVAVGETISTAEGGWLGISNAEGETWWDEIAGVRAILFDSTALVPLADLTPTTGRPTIGYHPDDRLLEEAAALNMRDLELSEPTTVAYDLPEGATRFAATIALERSSSPWADCAIVVYADGTELKRIALSAQQPASALNVRLPDSAKVLTIVLDEGDFGPIHDAVRLMRPMIAVDAQRSSQRTP